MRDGRGENVRVRVRPEDVPLGRETTCRPARNAYTGPYPWHLTATQVSWIPAGRDGDEALDLGCGHGQHRRVLEGLGYRWRGADAAGEAAMDVVDAHALPYADDRFALVLSIAVLEHLAEPITALREVRRVLRPGHPFVGTVAFGEPYHDESYCHLSPLGLAYCVRAAGLDLEMVAPVTGWSAIRAQLAMGLGTRVPDRITRALASPLVALLRLHARLARPRDAWSDARHAGALFFVAWKPRAGAFAR